MGAGALMAKRGQPHPQRKWTDVDRERGLDAVARLGSYVAAERETEIPDSTLQDWAQDGGTWERRLGEIRDSYTRERLAAIQRSAVQVAGELPASIATLANIRDSADRTADRIHAAKALVDGGATIDKIARLDRGEPTERTEDVTDPAALRDRLRELVQDDRVRKALEAA